MWMSTTGDGRRLPATGDGLRRRRPAMDEDGGDEMRLNERSDQGI